MLEVELSASLAIKGEDVSQLASKGGSRFNCPYPGCNRSFGELWRLKVHYRAPPEVRGSGKERGHGKELDVCPKCWSVLQPGKHHVGCASGKTTQRKRSRIDPGLSSVPRAGGSEEERQYQKYAVSKAGAMSDHSGLPGLDGHMKQEGAMFMLPNADSLTPTFGISAQQDVSASVSASQRSEREVPQQMPEALLPAENEFLLSMFEEEEPLVYVPSAPSPPHLPSDFPSVMTPAPQPLPPGMAPPPGVPEPLPVSADGMLFNFGQFSQRMPAQSEPHQGDPLLGLSKVVDHSLMYSPNSVAIGHDDGDIMHLLFGVPYEFPTMSTTHMHQRGAFTRQPMMDCMEGVMQSAEEANVGSQLQQEEEQQQQHQRFPFIDPSYANSAEVWTAPEYESDALENARNAGLTTSCPAMLDSSGAGPHAKKMKQSGEEYEHDLILPASLSTPSLNEDVGHLAGLMCDAPQDPGLEPKWDRQESADVDTPRPACHGAWTPPNLVQGPPCGS